MNISSSNVKLLDLIATTNTCLFIPDKYCSRCWPQQAMEDQDRSRLQESCFQRDVYVVSDSYCSLQTEHLYDGV